ncbi:MAG: PAS domain-containing protein [Verrucomicrobia bacterium]|jgi:PAS domain S-box-containing protein|nr:PAS domain-containing protein [Verrucomicrobiota bacterium]
MVGVLSEFWRATSILLFTGVALFPVLAVSEPDADIPLPLAEICRDADGDHLPDLLGQTVTATGVVTVGVGTFHTKRLQGFMQDGTGGIQLFSNRSDLDVHEGDVIRVRGRVGNHKGQTQLRIQSYGLLKPDVALPDPVQLSLRSASAQSLERQEGMLAVVRGRIAGKLRNQGGQFLLLEEDGVTLAEEKHRIIVFVHNTRSVGISLDPYSVGDVLEIRGIVSQYDYGPPYSEDHEILPIKAGDICTIGLTRRFYRRALAVGLPVSLALLAWMVGLRLQIAVHTRKRLEAERRLSAERERQSVTLGSIGEGVIATDTGGSVTVMNHRAESLVGLSEQTAIGLPLAEVFPMQGASSGRTVSDIVREVLEANTVLTLPSDTVLVCREGEKIQITCTASPVATPGGAPLGVVFVFDDCSERARIEAELQKASRLESIGLLAGGIAHDFNNILTTIAGNLSLARLEMPAGVVSKDL